MPARISLRPKKSLSQHFLQDENIARKIVTGIHPRPDDIMLEIGSGEGAITRYIAGRVGKLIIVEIDSRAIEMMRDLFAGKGVTVLHQDILETDLRSISDAHQRRIRIVGNIPYNITSHIIFHVLDQRDAVKDMTLMIQKEVARRLVARPRSKEYGILSVFCQLYADVRNLFDVSPNAFYPKPKVTSSVIQMTMLDRPRYELKDEMFFRKMIRAVFGKRRKTLRNSLLYFVRSASCLPSGFDLGKRPEELSIQELVGLGNALAEDL